MGAKRRVDVWVRAGDKGVIVELTPDLSDLDPKMVRWLHYFARKCAEAVAQTETPRLVDEIRHLKAELAAMEAKP